MVGVTDGVVALDGKTVCGSRDGENTALHMISAFATGSRLCLGQEETRGKGHEIAGIKALPDRLPGQSHQNANAIVVAPPK